MSGLIRHPLTGEWVLYAPERGIRPGAFEVQRSRRRTASTSCPFCPGNEHETPPEIQRQEAGGSWRIRVVPNRYPAITSSDAGAHEVIIESPDHDARFHLLDSGQATAILNMHQMRFATLSDEPGVRFITLFKNDGAGSGQSIDHLHSQILALPVVPPRAAMMARGFATADGCPLCQMLAGNASLTLQTSGSAVAVVPAVPLHPYEIWIIPTRHAPAFTGAGSEETTDLAHLMQNATRALLQTFDEASYNWIVHNSPSPPSDRFHWFVQLFPRLTIYGGFELGSGMVINIIEPARAAEVIREAMQR